MRRRIQALKWEEKSMGKYKKFIISGGAILLLILMFTYSVMITREDTIQTNANEAGGLSNKKIGWGIKRDDKHNQPDVGKVNKTLLDQQDGICLGNKEKPYLYLTFDEGYEAGYTERILDTLKANNVKAAFFITAHYLNTQEDLVKRMIAEGHIVRKSCLKYKDDLKK